MKTDEVLYELSTVDSEFGISPVEMNAIRAAIPIIERCEKYRKVIFGTILRKADI